MLIAYNMNIQPTDANFAVYVLSLDVDNDTQNSCISCHHSKTNMYRPVESTVLM